MEPSLTRTVLGTVTQCTRLEAASRIVEINDALVAGVLGIETRSLLAREQSVLWDEHFEGRPFEQIVADAWMHKVIFKY